MPKHDAISPLAKTVIFTIPGKPQGKSRPRFGQKCVYTDKKTTDYEKTVKLLYRHAAGLTTFPDKTPIRIDIRAYYPIPKRTSGIQRTAMCLGKLLPTKRPDLDNVSKIILDALNGIAYHDDAQIAILTASKLYANEPHVTVTVQEIT